MRSTLGTGCRSQAVQKNKAHTSQQYKIPRLRHRRVVLCIMSSQCPLTDCLRGSCLEMQSDLKTNNVVLQVFTGFVVDVAQASKTLAYKFFCLFARPLKIIRRLSLSTPLVTPQLFYPSPHLSGQLHSVFTPCNAGIAQSSLSPVTRPPAIMTTHQASAGLSLPPYGG